MAVITLRSLGFYGTSCVEEGEVLSRLMKLYFDFHSCDREHKQTLITQLVGLEFFLSTRAMKEKSIIVYLDPLLGLALSVFGIP